jgi:hypothetical protein
LEEALSDGVAAFNTDNPTKKIAGYYRNRASQQLVDFMLYKRKFVSIVWLFIKLINFLLFKFVTKFKYFQQYIF